MSWQPLADQILVRPLIAADRTASGLLIPDAGREKPQTGIVIAVGPGDLNGWANQIAPGDLVAFGKYAGVSFDLDGQDVLLMREREALAKQAAGSFRLVEHEVAHGITTRTVAHEASGRCEHCAEEKADFESFRNRMLKRDVPEATGDGPDGVRS